MSAKQFKIWEKFPGIDSCSSKETWPPYFFKGGSLASKQKGDLFVKKTGGLDILKRGESFKKKKKKETAARVTWLRFSFLWLHKKK